MALTPRDEIHANQINAGIIGRNRGHEFEKSLAAAINNIADFDQQDIQIDEHLFIGHPAEKLLNYVLFKKSYSFSSFVKAHWLGGLATHRDGDVLKDSNNNIIRAAKSDIVLEFKNNILVGISVKNCNKTKPTNDQLFCSTANAFYNILLENGITSNNDVLHALKMFCGDIGYRPLDTLPKEELLIRKANPERWFWEEIPDKERKSIEEIFVKYQNEITRLLFEKAYKNDPITPEFVFHKTTKASSPEEVESAIFTVSELIDYSAKYSGFKLNDYSIRKGRFKADPNIHNAPRFGFIQFQRLGNKQNATQLQFNLQAGYFYKLKKQNQ